MPRVRGLNNTGIAGQRVVTPGILATIAAISLFASQALAEIHHAACLEWKTTESPLVLTGIVQNVKVTSSGNQEDGAHFQTEDVSVRVTQVMKGSFGAKTLNFAWRPLGADSAKKWQTSGHEMLFFFSKADSPEHVYTLKDSEETVDLATGTAGYYPTVSQDLTVPKTKSDILSKVNAQLALIKSGKTSGKSLTIDVPDNTAAFKALFAESAVLLTVPYEHAKDFPLSRFKNVRGVP